MLSIEDKWVWDFWIAKDGDDFHIFFLQADKSLKDPDLRHWNASVGHAVSTDLENWKVLPDALKPSETMDAPDSLSTWTGSVIKNGSVWYMFYTGTSKVEDGLIQRVCLAKSSDLISWEKVGGNPVLEVDTQYYDTLNLEDWKDESWRDPWLYYDEDKALYHMLVTSRTNQGPADGRGAIGHAISSNLSDWHVQKPLFAPGFFGEIEVPQLEKIDDKFYLFFSVSNRYISEKGKNVLDAFPLTAMAYVTSEKQDGPYDEKSFTILQGDDFGSLYAGRVVRGPNDQLFMMAFENETADGGFKGTISSPIKIRISDTGKLTLDDTGAA